MQEGRFQDEPVESEEERRRRRKEEKKAKKEKRAMEEKKKKEEEAGGGNIGYFVMRTPSVLDNSKQDEDEYLTTHVVHKPLKSEYGNTQFSQNIQSRSPTQPSSLDRNTAVTNEEGGMNRWREVQEVRDGFSSEDEGAEFFDSVSTPSSSSQHQRDKSMGVLYFDLCSSLD